MNLSGTFGFAGPRATVWALLHDPAVLAKALPGTKTLTLAGPGRYEGAMKVSIGPLTAAEFAVVVTLTDETEPSHFAMQIDGKGGVGFARGGGHGRSGRRRGRRHGDDLRVRHSDRRPDRRRGPASRRVRRSHDDETGARCARTPRLRRGCRAAHEARGVRLPSSGEPR